MLKILKIFGILLDSIRSFNRKSVNILYKNIIWYKNILLIKNNSFVSLFFPFHVYYALDVFKWLILLFPVESFAAAVKARNAFASLLTLQMLRCLLPSKALARLRASLRDHTERDIYILSSRINQFLH